MHVLSRPPRAPCSTSRTSAADPSANLQPRQLWIKLRDRSTPPEQLAKIVDVIRARGLVREPKEFTMLISSCGRQGRWTEALDLLKEMQDREMEPNAYAYSAAISACERGSGGMGGDKALAVLAEMRRLNLPLDVVAYCSAITACEVGKRWDQALHLLSEMRADEVQVNTIICNAAVKACCTSGRWQEAFCLLDDMRGGSLRADVITFSSMIRACEGEGQWERALWLLDDMQGSNIRTDVISCSAAITACAEAWPWALQLLSTMMEEGPRPNVVSFGAAVSACEKVGQWEWSLELLKVMQAQGFALSVIPCSAAIGACARGLQWEWAMELFGEMLRRKLTPNRITYGAAIFACAARWESALGLLRRAQREERLHILEITYTTVITALGRGGRWDLACELLVEQQRAGRHINEITYSATLRACEQGGQVEAVVRVVEDMQRQELELDAMSYNSALAACSQADLWERMLSLLEGMAAHRVSPNKDTFMTAVMEAEQRRTLDLEVLRGPSEEGLRPKLGPSDDAATAATLILLEDSYDRDLAAAVRSCLHCARVGIIPHNTDMARLRKLRLHEAYAKELRALRRVLDHARLGDPSSVCAEVEAFNTEELVKSDFWTKIAGGMKAEVLMASMRGAPDRPVLEIGTYVGYSALRIASLFREASITTLEVDPVHVAVARAIIGIAGLAERVHVLTGHSERLLPRLAGASREEAPPRFGTVFMDRWGSQYHEDLALLEQNRLLAPGALLVADNVRRTGAPLLLWRVAAEGPFHTCLARVREFASGPLDQDWISVSVRKRRSGGPVPSAADVERGAPSALVRMHHRCEHMRDVGLASDRSATAAAQEALALDMERCLASFGIGVACSAD